MRPPRHTNSIVFVLLLPLVLSLITTLQAGLPIPIVHDEHAQLLMAKTFASGRLTNPIHPMGVFFETFHVLQSPSYMGKFPPGGALFMTLGQVVFGHPIAGVWLGISLATLALWWMLRICVKPRWALLGACIFATHPLVRQWACGYWGAGVAVLGAALYLGGLFRCVRRPHNPRKLHAFLLAAGLVLMANTRPAEGLLTVILSLPAAWLLLRRPRPTTWRPWPALAMIAGVLACAGSWMAYYNYRVTGSALTFPQALHAQQYAVAPLFEWEAPRPMPHYNHQVLKTFHTGTEWSLYRPLSPIGPFLQQRLHYLQWVGQDLEVWGTPPRLSAPFDWSFASIVTDYRWGFLLTLPCIACIAAAWRSRYARFALLLLLLWPLGQLAETYCMTRYLSPLLPILLLTVVLGLRWTYGQAGRLGRTLTVLYCVILFAWHGWMLTSESSTGAMIRSDYPARLIAQQLTLSAPSTPALVFVRYPPSADGQGDWVYNDPDIDSSAIVWARDMGQQQDHALINYYPLRQPWLYDDASGQLRPFPSP